MPTRLLLEGGDLQELLAQVREEHGSRAKIVSAERVRAGGLTGLLRAERYELTVELSDEEGGAAVAVGAPAVRAAIAPSGSHPYETHVMAGQATVDRSAPAVMANQPAYPDAAKAGNAPRPAVAPPARQATMPAIAGAPEGAGVDELLALLEQRENSAQDQPAGSGFDEVLAELRGAAVSANAGLPHAAAQGTMPNAAAALAGAPIQAATGMSYDQPGMYPGAPNGIPHGIPDGTANGIPHGVADGAANGGVMSATNGTSNGATVHNGGSNGAPPSVHNGPSNGASNGTGHHTPHGVANGMAHAMTQGVAPVSAQPATHPYQPQPHPAHQTDQHPDQSALESALEAALPNSLRSAPSPTSTENTGFSMDPIFAPAKSTPEAPPAAQGHAGPTAPASTPNGGTTGARGATTARPTAAARTRPLSPDPRRPNHFLSFGDLETAPADSPLPQKLADLGLPQRVIERLPLGEAYPAIVRALLDEPSAPHLPSGPGMIITIIGELTGALAVAEDVARILRLDPDRILIASESPQVGRHMADPGDAGRQAARLRGGDQPRIVCVDAPAPTAWVQSVVVALRPDAVWCAVDATRKPADVARQLRSLPRVDALAVHALEATADPASPLALGVPVALLDGQPAGPHGWAALLCRRLFEEEFAGGDR